MHKTTTVVTDDLTGQEGASTITFGLRGRTYEIDLVEANAAKLDKALAPYIDKARRPSTNGRRPASSQVERTDRAAVRAWANANGYALGNRGRIPAVVQSAYDEATG